MNTKALRQKILDLAIRGKLVPQDPNDEPASVLLERIRAEKERLIKEGKIKRPKKAASSDTPHYENVPFEVPEEWTKVRLEEICSFLSRGKSPKYSDERKYPVFAQKCNLKEGGISLDKAQFLDPETLSKWTDDYKLRTGDVLINSTGTGTVGRTRYFDEVVLGEYPFVVPDSHVSVVRTMPGIVSKYIYAVISSPHYQQYLEDNLAGSTNQKELYIGVLSDMEVSIPPYKEQQRIVDAIEKWCELIAEVEFEQNDLQTLIDCTKSKILDLAIHGKLVPQGSADEPAIDLLHRINPNFQPCDTSQYENLPQGWCECKLEDVIDYEQPQAYIVESTNYSDEYETPVLTAGKSFIIGYTNETKGVFNNLPVIIFDDFTTDSKYVDFPFKVKSSAMKILHVKDGINVQYISMLMSITRLTGDTHKRYWISEYSKLPIMLPPKQEQDTIVKAVCNIFKYIDSISQTLAD